MSASSTCTALTVCNLALTSARCTGFTKEHRQNDFSYVLDLEWTDERAVSVKRTFSEFQKFHTELTRTFPELHNSKLNLRTSFRENIASLFMKDKRNLAEKRESMLDEYLRHLLRQPERVRYCNLVLSFFDSRDTDPKPCKSNAPSEKADSGIDLTGENAQVNHIQDSDTAKGFQAKDYYDTNQNRKQHNGNDLCTDEEYDGDTSEYDGDTTETEDDTFDGDYFLDVGFGELMLQPSGNEERQLGPESPLSPTMDGAESSMWCSNLDKFSNILRSSMTNLNALNDNQNKSYRTLTSRTKSVDNIADSNTILEELAEEFDRREETSETESQQAENKGDVQDPSESE